MVLSPRRDRPLLGRVVVRRARQPMAAPADRRASAVDMGNLSFLEYSASFRTRPWRLQGEREAIPKSEPPSIFPELAAIHPWQRMSLIEQKDRQPTTTWPQLGRSVFLSLALAGWPIGKGTSSCQTSRQNVVHLM